VRSRAATEHSPTSFTRCDQRKAARRNQVRRVQRLPEVEDLFAEIRNAAWWVRH